MNPGVHWPASQAELGEPWITVRELLSKQRATTGTPTNCQVPGYTRETLQDSSDSSVHGLDDTVH